MTSSPPDKPASLRRALLALWLSIAVHAVIIGLVRVTPRTVVTTEPVLEVRLETPVPMPSPQAPEMPVLLNSSEKPEKLVSIPELQPVVLQALPETHPAPQSAPLPEASAITSAPEQARPNNPDSVKSEPGPNIEVPLLVDTHYYRMLELDVQPKPIGWVKPEEFQLNPEEPDRGYAIIEIQIESDGRISSLRVAEVHPPELARYAEYMRASFEGIRFVPAKKNGQPVRSLLRMKTSLTPTE